jgi:hypothetical protein
MKQLDLFDNRPRTSSCKVHVFGGNLTGLQRAFLRDGIYMERYQQCVTNTPSPGFYRVTGPVSFDFWQQCGSMMQTVGVQNSLLGKIVRPVVPPLGKFVTSSGKIYVEVLEKREGRVCRSVVMTRADLKLHRISNNSITGGEAVP